MTKLLIGWFALLCVYQTLPAAAAETLRAGPVEVTPDGAVRYGGALLGQLPLPPPPRTLEISNAVVEGHRLIHVFVRGVAGRNGELVAELDAGPGPRVLFAGLTGPQGIDGEWSRHLRVAPSGLVIFDRRDDIYRCDEEPLFLFPRRYDFAQRRFRPATPPLPQANVQGELVASRTPPGAISGPPLAIFRLIAASTHRGDGQRAADLLPPRAAEDGDLATSWAEGLGSAGQGEFLTAAAPSSLYRLKAIQIVPGEAADRKRFAEANRLERVLLALSPVKRFRIRFPRDPLSDVGSFRDPYWIVLPEPVATRCATLVIEQVYPGRAAKGSRDQGGRTAIAELRFFTDADLSGGAAQVVKDLKSTDPRRHRPAAQILVRLGEHARTLLLPELTRAGPPLLHRVVDVLARAPFAGAAPALATALSRMPARTRARALEALEALGQPAAEALSLLLVRGDDAVRSAVAPVLGELGGPAARGALLAVAGEGGDRRRAAVVTGIAQLRAPETLDEVLAAARAAGRGPRAADLVLAAGRLGSAAVSAATPSERAAALANARQAAARLAVIWRQLPPREDAFELRHRLLRALGHLDAGGQLPLLAHAAVHEEPVLRWVAVQQLARVPRATAILLQALDDTDPRVRTTAATALAGRRGATIARALARRLQRETWPFVGSAIADALASHCSPGTNRALRRAVAAARAGVEEAALVSLATCRPPGLFEELLALARDERRRDALRGRALALLPVPPSSRARDELVSLFLKLRRLALSRATGERLAIIAARAVGKAEGEPARRALADTLALDPQPAIRAAAARALGDRCDPAACAAIDRAKTDATPLVRQAAKAAAKRCGW